MTHRRGLAAGAILLAILSVPGRSCGPFFLQADFITNAVNLDSLRRNIPTVIHTTSGTRDLAIAYRILNGPPLTSDEWAIAIPKPAPPPAVIADNTATNSSTDDNNGAVYAQWQDARKAVLPNAEVASIITDRAVPGNDWESFTNCLPDAYANAARTLNVRRQTHPQPASDLVDWVHAQDAVFSNCADVAAGDLPATLPVSAPLWLRQDRAYQIAAAHFYRLEWPEAIAAFQSIAADRSSPWHDLAAYLVARSLIRQSTLGHQSFGFDPAPLRKAEQQLIPLAASHSSISGPATQLLDFVQIRVSPGIAAARLGDRISQPDPSLQQNLIDLAYAFNHLAPNQPMTDRVAGFRKSDLADWVFCMQFGIGPYGDSVQRWRQTHSLRWLVPAITNLRSPDPDILKAAAEVPHDSPAWASVTYARLRLLHDDSATSAELESVRAELARRHADLSTQNLFKQLALGNAATLAQYMKLAPMRPVGFGYDDGDDFSADGSKATMAGLPVNNSIAERIDTDTATIVNQMLPLSTLVTATLESDWPKQLRFELAMAVWTRAVLLNKPEEARRLTSLLIEGEPGWKTWLTAYDNAATQSERTVTALLALMRFPSVRPYINGGPGREEGFVGYSVFRDNWWCSGMGIQNNGYESYLTSYNYNGGSTTVSPAPRPVPVPPFITPAMSTEVAVEQAQLLKIGDAPAYFGHEALTWVKAHPKDSRAPELLGFAFRAMRNGCNLESSTPLRHEVFDALHTAYPNSEWARHYSTFDTNPE